MIKKHFYPTIFLLLLSLCLSAQENIWQTAIYASDDWRYIEGSSSVPDNWREIGFDDSSWNVGPGGIGYGDGDDQTIIAQTLSLFMRRTFTLSDKSKILEILFSGDYDDGYIAYLNGVEISRENITGPGTWDNTTDGEREGRIYQGGGPAPDFLEDNFNSVLVDGENVLAVQTHNWSANSSDLTTLYWLSFLSTEALPEFGPLDEIINVGNTGNSGGFDSTLPIVRINTNDQEIPDEPKIFGEMEIVWNGNGALNNSLSNANEFSGNIRIEKRGQSSLFIFPKVSYLFETVDQNEEDLDVSFLNFPAEEDFILHGPYSDKTLMRNVLIFDIANKMGQYASRTRYVELMVNDSYQGIYVMMERIKRDENRVDIAKLNVDEIEGDDLTGGYIIKIDKGAPDWVSAYDVATASDKKLQYQLVYPRRDDIVPEQREYIKTYVDSFEQVMVTPGSTLNDKSYLDFIDIESFVDHFLLVEFSMDVDAYRFSSYMYKDKDSKGGKLQCGPLWDFNLSFGNADYCDGWMPTGYMYNRQCDQGNPFWWGRLMQQEEFRDHAKCRWQELREGVLHQDNLFQYIDEQVNLLSPAIERNYEQWPILDQYVWPNPVVTGSYEGEIEVLKEFITGRLQWMDNNLFGICDSTITVDPEEGFDFVISPNPSSDYLNILFGIELNVETTIEIYDMLGRSIPIKIHGFEEKKIILDVQSIRSGVYNLLVTQGGKEYGVVPFIIVN